MDNRVSNFFELLIAVTVFVLSNCATVNAPATNGTVTIGAITCTNGTWIPDFNLFMFGVTCPLPLDGKASSKGKTAVCILKKSKLYDGEKKSAKIDKFSPTLCAIFKQNNLQKRCKETVKVCLKNAKEYFKDPKSDKEYKTWSVPYECLEKWVTSACKT